MNEGEISMVEAYEKTFQEEKVNRGSEWRKWDLHLHTASSYDYKYKASDADAILIGKLREFEISAVAITDHFLIDKNRIINLKKLAPEIQFFPGVELRTDKGSSNIHVILIFSNEMDLDILCSDFDYFKRYNSKASESDETIFWDYKEIVEFAKKRNAIISVHAGSKSSGLDDKISNSLPHSQAIKRDYSDTVDIFEMGKEKDCEGYITHVFPVIGEKPLIISSDNHDARNYDDSKCLWIKGDLTFEGLKQILFEPRERIYLGKLPPDQKSDYMLIDYIEFEGDERIYFNSGLNAIIGGRSTGKSTLLNSIAKFQHNENTNAETQNFFCDGEYSIVWADGKSDTTREVEFLPQEYMINLSRSKETLNKLIGEIIRKKGMTGAELDYKNKISQINIEIYDALTQYFGEEEKLRTLIIPEGNLDAAKKEIAILEDKIEKLRLASEFTEEENIEYRIVCSNLFKLDREREVLANDARQLNYLKEHNLFLEIDFTRLSVSLKNRMDSEFQDFKESVTRKWKEILNEKIIIIEKRQSQIGAQIENIILSEIFQKGRNLESQNSESQYLNRELERHKKVKENLEEYLRVVQERSQRKRKLFENILEKFAEYFYAIEQFCSQFPIVQGDLSIDIKPVQIDMEEKINYLNSRNKVNNNFINQFDEVIGTMDVEKIKEYIDEHLLSDNYSFIQNKNLNNLISDIFSNWYTYNYTVTYQSDEFKDMSQGKRSFVILKLLLEFSADEKPVLIDQPEDSLDNRAIYHELRKYLIDTKKKRQIIVVTHNPNVVVGADSENVIVAHQQSNLERNQNGKKFQYINGPLENTKEKDFSGDFVLESQGIREHIFDVLEGGEEAFAKREQKYNYRKS